ncbi:putative HAT and BED zinc finger domain-containing protein, partial [Trifolium medium]|nr:putative HAT and BED zinc finger domain-containing protein [Trifolium medium]
MASSETPSSQPPSQPPSQPQSQEASSAPSLVERNFRRKRGINWSHCKLLPDKSIVCMYCNKNFGGGGIHRVKQHLAGVHGDTEICKDVPAEVRFLVKQNYDEQSKKRKTSDVAESESATAKGGELQTNSAASKKGKNVGRI